MKEKLRLGHAATMVNVGHPSSSMAELLGRLGVDAVFIDCEHGMAGPERVQEMCRAVRYAGSVPIVRSEANRDWLITRYLDAGAGGIMVPHIDTAEDARALVSAVRYAKPKGYEALMVIALVESVRALENLQDIAAVQGIDALFVGSGDLANNLNLADQRFHPEVVARVTEAGRRIVQMGKVAGTRVTTQNAPQFLEAGFRLLYENANAFVTAGARDFMAACRAAPGSQTPPSPTAAAASIPQ